MHNFFQSIMNSIYKNFAKDSAKMLIVTGAIGWALSSLAQVSAIVLNNKISDKEKSFLIPQEIADAFVNVASFVAITMTAKKVVSKLFSTAKWTTPKVKKFLENNKDLYKDKIGKLNFNIEKEICNEKDVFKEYKSYSSLGTTLAAVGGGIVASNIVTPILRNRTASNVQKSYIAETKELEKLNKFEIRPQKYTNGGMKI